MAKKVPRKRSKRKGPKRIPRTRKPPSPLSGATKYSTGGYDPTRPSFSSSIDADREAVSQAQATIDVGLNDIGQERARETGRSNRRIADLGAWYTEAQNRASQAMQAAQAAQSKLISMSNTNAGEGQNLLAAALAGTQQQSNDFAKMLGATPLAGDATGVGTAAQQAAINDQLLKSNAAASQAAMGEGIANLGVGLVNARQGEQARSQGVLDDLATQEQGLRARLPELIDQNRARLDEREIGKVQNAQQYDLAVRQFGEQRANRLFQQWLAEQELDLKGRNQSFQEWLGKQELGQGNRGLDIEQQNADTSRLGTLADVEARTTETKDKRRDELAKLRGERRTAGVTALNNYLSAGKDEMVDEVDPKTGDKTGRKVPVGDPMKSRSFDTALNMLRTEVGMGDLESLYLIRDHAKGRLNDPYMKRWYDRARKIINDHLHPGWRKRRPKKKTPKAGPVGNLLEGVENVRRKLPKKKR